MHDLPVLLKAFYEEEARNGLQNIKFLTGLVQGHVPIQQVEDLLSIIDVQRAYLTSLQNRLRLTTGYLSSPLKVSIPGMG